MAKWVTPDQEQCAQRVFFLQREVAACKFHAEPCPLLWTQLNEAKVLVDRLQSAIRHAQEVFEKDC